MQVNAAKQIILNDVHNLEIKFQADKDFFYRTNIVIARHNILLEAREKSQNESREHSQNESESHSNSSTISRSGTRLAEEWPVKRGMRALSASPLRGSEPPPAEPPPSLKGSEIDDNDWSGYFFLLELL